MGVGLLATLLGLTASVRWAAAVLAAACLLVVAALRSVPRARPGRAPPPGRGHAWPREGLAARGLGSAGADPGQGLAGLGADPLAV